MHKLFTWFHNLRIRTKLLAAFMLILLLTVSVSAVSIVGTDSLNDSVAELFEHDVRQADLATEIAVASLNLRNTEKEYLLNYKELGFEEAATTLVSFAEQQSELITARLDELKEMVSDEHTLSLIESVYTHNTDFHLYFLETVDYLVDRGFKDYGLEGEFRAKVSSIEKAIDTLGMDRLAVDMLMIRRHEKDYLLRGEARYLDQVAEAVDKLKTDVGSADIDSALKDEMSLLADEYLVDFRKLAQMDVKIEENTAYYRTAIDSMKAPLDEIVALAVANQTGGLADMKHTSTESMYMIEVMSAVAVALGLVIAFVLARLIAGPVAAITAVVRKMAAGSLDEKLEVRGRDEIGQLSASMQEMQQKLKTIIQSEIHHIIKNAGDGNLSDRLDLQNKAGFYRELAASINDLIEVNEHFLNDTAAVVSDLADGKLDTRNTHQFKGDFAKVQQDITRMRENFIQVISKDVQSIVQAASRGELDGRINVQGQAGFYLELSKGINSLVETNASIINDCNKVIGALASGSFDAKFASSYAGSFGTLQEYVERMHANLQQAIEKDIQSIVTAAANGDLKQRINMEHKQGFYQKLSASINDLVDTSDRIISDASRVLGSVAKGDLTQTITNEYKGTFRQLKNDINKTVNELISTVENIQKAASSVDVGSSEISSGNANLSQRTEEQAASLEETSAAMEELTTTVQLTAENSLRANQLSQESIQTAVKGGDIVNEAIRSMDQIKTSSFQISEIVSVIDEIAFQTNLLALNASVEAARAGEQGRGFAVVADEVRVLAGRCAKAAKEIKELIVNSSKNVQAGSELANKSGVALQEIIVAAKKVNSIIAEISTACDEQATGLHEINVSLTQMDTMTQQNAALVEEAAAASESLSEQSRDLSQLISFFKIDQRAGMRDFRVSLAS